MRVMSRCCRTIAGLILVASCLWIAGWDGCYLGSSREDIASSVPIAIEILFGGDIIAKGDARVLVIHPDGTRIKDCSEKCIVPISLPLEPGSNKPRPATLITLTSRDAVFSEWEEGCKGPQDRCAIAGTGTVRVKVKFTHSRVNVPKCGVNDWCWVNPRPITADLKALWVNSETDVWMVGGGGTVWQMQSPDGANPQLSVVPFPSDEDLIDVYSPEMDATRPEMDAVWAIGAKTAWLRRGGPWTEFRPPNIDAIHQMWGDSTDGPWIVGTTNRSLRVLRWDRRSTTWQDESPDGAEEAQGAAIGGNRAGSVWVATGPRIWQRSKLGWSQLSSVPECNNVTSITSCAPNDVWVACGQDGVFRFIDNQWSPIGMSEKETPPFNANSTYCAKDDIFAYSGDQLARFVETSFKEEPSPNRIVMLRGTGNTLFAVGTNGMIGRWQRGPMKDTAGWEILMRGGTDGDQAGIWGSSETEAWTATSSTIGEWDGKSWTWSPSLLPDRGLLLGNKADNVWLLGKNGGLRKTAKDWQVTDSGGAGSLCTSGHIGAKDDIVCLDGKNARSLSHFDGTTWTPIPLPSKLKPHGVWKDGEGGLWVVAESPEWKTLWYRANGKFDMGFEGKSVGVFKNLYAIWGFSAKDIWMAGDGGAVVHWDGNMFNSIATGTTKTLRAIWGGKPGDLWIVGDRGTILRCNNMLCQRQKSGAGVDLYRVFGSGSRVWVGGAQGTLLSRQGP